MHRRPVAPACNTLNGTYDYYIVYYVTSHTSLDQITSSVQLIRIQSLGAQLILRNRSLDSIRRADSDPTEIRHADANAEVNASAP
jgi:hypothetical protein